MLLDTQTAVWWLTDDPRLSAAATAAIETAFPDVAISAASIWELEIKRAANKFGGVELAEACPAAGIRIVDITAAHAVAAAHLPPHHRDPFDRMIVAQASLQQRPIVSSDRQLPLYDVTVVW